MSKQFSYQQILTKVHHLSFSFRFLDIELRNHCHQRSQVIRQHNLLGSKFGIRAELYGYNPRGNLKTVVSRAGEKSGYETTLSTLENVPFVHQ